MLYSLIESINQFLLPAEKFVKKYKIWISRLLILSSFGSLSFIFLVNGSKESGEKAITLLWIILWLPILARVFSLKLAQALLPLRKEFGILMGTIAFVHGSLYIVPYYEELFTQGFWIVDNRLNYLGVGFVALLLILPLTLTSNTWSMKALGKYWKMLHRLVYIVIILVVTHVVLLQWYSHFEVVPVLLLILYFIGKILEWKNISFARKQAPERKKGQKWICTPCGYVYDPVLGDEDSGISAGTEFEDIPDDWRCPLCGVSKSDFIPYNEEEEEMTSNVTVKNITLLNPSTLELVIETEEDHKAEPGQFMSFLWKDADGAFPRSYSIARQDGRYFTFLIKLGEKGRGATILRQLHVGDTVRIRSIAGRFILRNTRNEKVFIATGTGLAPIYRMVTEANTLFPEVKKHLYFTVSTRDDLFYTEELEQIPNLDLHIHLSKEELEGYYFGRVDIDGIEASRNAEWYLCGNPKMVSEAREIISKKGWKNIYSEEF